MPNEYYNHENDFVFGTLAREDAVNAKFDAIEAGLDKLPTEAQLKQGNLNFVVGTGTANTYVVAMPYTLTAYREGYTITFRANATNTGASTLNVDGLGPVSLKRGDNGAALGANDILAGTLVTATYYGTSFYITSQIHGDYANTVIAKDIAVDSKVAAETAQGLAEDARDAAIVAQGLAEDAQAAAELAASEAIEPIGDMKHFPAGENPTGWLEMDEGVYLKSAYPALSARHPQWDMLFSDVYYSNANLMAASSPGYANSLFVDDDYVYVGKFMGSAPTFFIFNRSDMSLVAGVPSGIGGVYSICSDATRVYLSSSSGFLTVLEKGTWSVVAGVPNPGHLSFAMSVDDDYLYCAVHNGQTAKIYNKTTWALEHSFAQSNGTQYSFFSDGTNVYYSSTASPYFKVLARGTWGGVAGAPTKSVALGQVHVDDTHMYIAIATGSVEKYDLATWTLQPAVPVDAAPNSVTNLVGDSEHLIVGTSKTGKFVQIFDKATLQALPHEITASLSKSMFMSGSLLFVEYQNGADAGLLVIDKTAATEFRIPLGNSTIDGTKYLVRAE